MKKRSLIILALLSGGAGIINFLYQATVASRLDPSSFSLFAALLSLVAAIGSGAAGFQVVTARVVSTHIDWSPKRQFLDHTARQALKFSVVVMLAGLVLSPLIANALRVNVGLVAVLGLFFPIAILYSLSLGRIQGSGALVTLGAVGLALSLLKLGSALSMLLIGGGVAALIVALLLTNLLMALVTGGLAARTGSSQAAILSRQTWILVIAQVSFWTLVSMDVLVARVILPDYAAGEFSAAATLAKMVLFLPGVLTTALIPWAGQLLRLEESRVRLAVLSLGLTLGLASLVALSLWLAGPLLVRYLFGLAYDPSIPIIAPLAWAYLPLALSSVLLQFHFTSHRHLYGVTTAGVLVAATTAILIFARDAMSIVAIVAGAGLVLLILLTWETMVYRKKSKHESTVIPPNSST